MIEGVRGSLEFEIRVAPRFDYGQVRPWIRRHGHRLHSTIGGNDALLVWCEQELTEDPEHELVGRFAVGPGDRVRLALTYCPPEHVDAGPPAEPEPDTLDEPLERTLEWWREWASTLSLGTRDEPAARRSGIVLKALTYAPTGAVVAAPTTSLPEAVGGSRNWDYRYAWVRDSSFSSRALAELGAIAEADAFRAFIMRSAAGHAEDLQIVYGVGGERRLRGDVVEGLEGYRKSAPVRLGNDASEQLQLDAYGELVNLTWRWHRRGHSPSDDDWRFLVSLIDHAAERWSRARLRDLGMGGRARALRALEGAVLVGARSRHPARRRVHAARADAAMEDGARRGARGDRARGYDSERGVYVQAFGRSEMDAALLLLPTVEYVGWDDERMLRTIAAVREELGAGDGLLYRYRRDDGLEGDEGAFLCCSFWLAECLARAGDPDDAREIFDQAVARSNDLGLFSEEIDPRTGELLGNFPQGLTHLAHIDAAVALAGGQYDV